MLKFFFILLLLILCTRVAYPQLDSIVAAFSSKAGACLERQQLDSAGMFHRAGLEVCRKNDRLDLWLRAYTSLAFAHAEILNQPLDAVDLLNEALDQAWREPSNELDWEQMVRIQEFKGYFYQYGDFNYANAVKYYEEAFRLFVSHLGEKNDKIANFIYHQLGNTYTRLGDYSRAESLLRRGIEYGERNQKPKIGRYGDLAIVLIDIGKNKEALEVIKKGLAISDAETGTLITALLSEARAWLNLGDLDAAQLSLRKVKPLVASIPLARNKASYLAGYHDMNAILQDSLGNKKAALRHFQKNIKYEIASNGTTNCREVGKAHHAFGSFLLGEGKPLLALYEFQQALQSVLTAFKPANDHQNPPATIFYAENTIIEALLGKAKAFLALGELERALECYELIPVVDAKLRATYAYEASSLLALRDSRRRFDEAIAIAWELYERSNGDRRYADRAFKLTEAARGMILLQSLAHAQAKYQLPEDLRRKEAALNIRIASYELEIAELRAAVPKDGEKGFASENEALLAALGKKLFDLKQTNETFNTDLRQRFPDYASLSDEIHFLASAAVPSLLQPGQALIDYYLTERDLFIFSFEGKGTFHWRKTALPAAFRESVQAFIEYLQKGDEADKAGEKGFRQMAYELYELLLAPELNRMMPQAGSLIIIPDDALVFIPFEVLLRHPVTEGNWPDLPWLLTDYNTGYAYSATLLQMQQTISSKHRAQKEATPYTFGGFAPSYASSGRYQLTSTEPLVNSARSLLGGKTWCGAAASEENFKIMAPACRVLLLAMHGLADAENPELSRLLFGDPAADSLENDNILYASELQIMQLQADLAVLSACHSGFGKLQIGEGVFSLARAFARAGVPATVMSMWLLHENTAAPLISSFLQYLQSGKTKDEALRQAKLDFLKNDQHFEMTHPFYWAGVTVSGDMCALDLAKAPVAWGWLLVAGAVLGFGLLLWQGGKAFKRHRAR